MKDVFVATPNFQRFQELYNWLSGDQFGVDMAIILGRAGRGKTTAARRIYTTNPNAVYVRFEEWLTHIGLLREIAFAVAGVRHRSTQACFDLLKEGLSTGGRVIMIDEADRMTLKHLNTLRDLHDICMTPIVLIGEESLEGRARQERRIMSRMREALKFEPVAQMDVLVFYKEGLGQEIPAKAASKLARHAQGDFRLVVKDALQVERAMNVSGIKKITESLLDEILK